MAVQQYSHSPVQRPTCLRRIGLLAVILVVLASAITVLRSVFDFLISSPNPTATIPISPTRGVTHTPLPYPSKGAPVTATDDFSAHATALPESPQTGTPPPTSSTACSISSGSGNKFSALPCSYTARSGDSYALISEKAYGSQNHLHLVRDVNRYKESGRYRPIRVNDILYIPKLNDTITLPEFPQCKIGNGSKNNPPCYYRVESGETYETISQFMYGAESYADEVKRANLGVNDKPVELRDGMDIVIPTRGK